MFIGFDKFSVFDMPLLSTGEDRAKALIEWSWAGFAHERPGRITVRTED